MKRGVSKFLSAVEGAELLADNAIIDIFVYYLTVVEDRPAATVTQITECFRDCDLSPPSRVAPYLSEGLRSKPQRFVKVDGGYKLHRQYRDAVSGRIGLNLIVQTKDRNSNTVALNIDESRPQIEVGTRDKVPNATGPGQDRAIFVVHGRNEAMKQTVARYVERLGLDPLILHEQVNRGCTIIEKFERNAAQASFAIVLMSGDDEGGPVNSPKQRNLRARQNVVVELGYFTALLGRSNVCVLVSDGVEIPSDYLGVVYTKYDAAGGWKLDLARELVSAGYEVDPANLLR
jgi:predicted nucleotide-binding protein